MALDISNSAESEGTRRILLGRLRALGQGRSGAVLRVLRNNTAIILLIAFVLAGGLVSDVFLTPRNLLNIMWAVSILGIIAMGQTLLLITSNFDMSVAFVVGLTGIVTVLAQIAGCDLVTSMLLGLVTGLTIGLLNGLVVVLTGANPFLVTLGTASLAYAVSLMLTQSNTLYAPTPDFTVLGRGRLFGMIHYSVLLFVVLAIMFEFILAHDGFWGD